MCFLKDINSTKVQTCRTSCLCRESKQYEYAGAPVILENSHCWLHHLHLLLILNKQARFSGSRVASLVFRFPVRTCAYPAPGNTTWKRFWLCWQPLSLRKVQKSSTSLVEDLSVANLSLQDKEKGAVAFPDTIQSWWAILTILDSEICPLSCKNPLPRRSMRPFASGSMPLWWDVELSYKSWWWFLVSTIQLLKSALFNPRWANCAMLIEERLILTMSCKFSQESTKTQPRPWGT